MKKILLIALCLLMAFRFYQYNKLHNCETKLEFEFRSGFSAESPGGRFAESKVVVNRNWDDPTLPDRIVESFIKMNGQPTTLRLELYYSNWHKQYEEPYLALEYNYQK